MCVCFEKQTIRTNDAKTPHFLDIILEELFSDTAWTKKKTKKEKRKSSHLQDLEQKVLIKQEEDTSRHKKTSNWQTAAEQWNMCIWAGSDVTITAVYEYENQPTLMLCFHVPIPLPPSLMQQEERVLQSWFLF